MNYLEMLEDIQKHAGPRQTEGLPKDVIEDFLGVDPKLHQVIDEAHQTHQDLKLEFPDLVPLGETELIERLQESYINFYPEDQRNPYVALAASGPWIVTAHGAVLHDSGGYGMLGFGHKPQRIIQAIQDRQVMANVMTPSFSQARLSHRLHREIGHARGDSPYAKFICMNSGSEAVTVASRISDINAKQKTDPGGPHEGKKIKFLALKGGFHGRTDRPAQASDSNAASYAVLASFRDLDKTYTVEPNNIEDLEKAFAWAEKENVFFESMFIEPVMGEGDPGRSLDRKFYDKARELTRRHGTLLLIDSIQAGLRATSCLSLCDYPGFEDCTPPDLETYSKALNAGQFPLSVIGLGADAAKLYVRGVYGNTMSTNPRALDVASAVLDCVSDELRRNIRDRGAEFLEKLGGLSREFPDVIPRVQGTGLLLSADINPDHFDVVGHGNLEEWLRLQGLGVIHGGKNALRFTPHFEITSKEIDLLISVIRKAITEGPRKR